MTSRHWAWPSAIAIAVLIAACGGSEESSGSTDTPATEAPPAPTAAPPATTPPQSEVSESTTTTTAVAPTTVPPVATDAPPSTEAPDPGPTADELNGYVWSERTDGAPWSARAGLRVVELDGRLLARLDALLELPRRAVRKA